MKVLKQISLTLLIIFSMTTNINAQDSLRTKEAVRKAMDLLIDRATNFDVEALDSIYHKDFHTTLVMPDGEVVIYNKQEFKVHFAKQAEEGKTQLNTWADWHDFHILDNSAVCVLTLSLIHI